MISIGNVVSVSDGARYFQEAVAASPADYYAARGEAAGVWRGQAAAELGLAGRVHRDDFVRILDGCHPATGDELGRHHATRKNVAFDVTFSLPKSVSLMYALGDDRVREGVLRALDAGATAAHEYLEDHAAWGRMADPQTHAIEHVRAQLVTAAFVHRTARPVTRDGVVTVDPQLHTHLVVASFAKRANGTWGQLHGQQLYAHAAAAGAIGQAATRDILVRELGVRVQTNPNGTFELEGFTAEQLAEFSQRHQQVMAAAEAAAVTSYDGLKVAVLASRESKSAIAPGTDHFEQWRDRAATLGLSPRSVSDLLDQEQVREQRWFDVDTAQAVIGRDEGGLTAQASVFSRRDLIRSLAAHTPLGMRREQIEELADAILADPAVTTPMVPAQREGESASAAMQRWCDRGMELHYSTPEVVALERRMLRSAALRSQERTLVIDGEHVRAAIATSGRHLTPDQREMVLGVCTSPAGVVVVEGAAGTGKTSAVRLIREIHADLGVSVIGCAPSNRAAVTLEQEAGVPTFTTAAVLCRVRDGDHLARGGLVIADECSMLGPDLAELVIRAEQDGAKLVLIGDSEQLQPIDGGALFRSLGDALGRISLTDVVRQRDSWDREVLMALRAGDAAPLVRRYLEEGRVHHCPDESSRVATIAADWVAASAEGHEVITIARERAAVAELNAVTREAAVEAGLVARTGVHRVSVDHVGHKNVPLGELEFAVGDRVLLVGRTQHHRDLVKGMRGTVVETAADGTLGVETADKRRLTVPPDYSGVAHGYALTAHRAQGATADIVLVHGSDAADRHWHYVALSRHRLHAAYYDVAPQTRDTDGVHHGLPVNPSWTDEGLVALMERDAPKPSTLDYPGAYDRQLVETRAGSGANGGATGPPTDKQLGALRDNGRLQDLPPAATRIHASLVLDNLFGHPAGESARRWLTDSGTPPDEAGRAVAMAMEEVTAGRGRSHIRDSRSSVMDRQRREKGTSSPENDLTERAKSARRRPGFSYYPQPEDPAAHQAPNRGPGMGW
jgi:conjugative relaxase-like TrwC/TraI family protein